MRLGSGKKELGGECAWRPQDIAGGVVTLLADTAQVVPSESIDVELAAGLGGATGWAILFTVLQRHW